MKADRQQAITIAWQVENFSRSGKSLKNLDDYLNPPTPSQKKRGLLDMFRRIHQKGQ